MGKVQTYGNLESYFSKVESFLLENEFKNNLFWEVTRRIRKRGKTALAANVFLNGKISMSCMVTPSGYLLLSEGERESWSILSKYVKAQKWKIKGVTGPDESVRSFSSEWSEGLKDLPPVGKEFMIYSSSCSRLLENRQPPSLKVVDPESWSRIRAWTTIFANESAPPVNASALLSISREMMNLGNLFILHKEGVGPCAMGGFGRSTPNTLVINEVFVPKDLRGMGYGSELISGLMGEAHKREVANCLLFSDFVGPINLYDRLGFTKVLTFCEQALE